MQHQISNHRPMKITNRIALISAEFPRLITNHPVLTFLIIPLMNRIHPNKHLVNRTFLFSIFLINLLLTKSFINKRISSSTNERIVFVHYKYILNQLNPLRRYVCVCIFSINCNRTEEKNV